MIPCFHQTAPWISFLLATSANLAHKNATALKKIIAMAEQTSGSGACSNADLRASGDGERLFVTVQASPPPELVRDGAVPASRHVATPDTSLNFDDDTRKSARALGESSDAGHENAFSGKHKEIDCGVQAVVADSSPPIDAGSPSASPTPVGWSSAKTLFFFRIERELEKVN